MRSFFGNFFKENSNIHYHWSLLTEKQTPTFSLNRGFSQRIKLQPSLSLDSGVSIILVIFKAYNVKKMCKSTWNYVDCFQKCVNFQQQKSMQRAKVRKFLKWYWSLLFYFGVSEANSAAHFLRAWSVVYWINSILVDLFWIMM